MRVTVPALKVCTALYHCCEGGPAETPISAVFIVFQCFHSCFFAEFLGCFCNDLSSLFFHGFRCAQTAYFLFTCVVLFHRSPADLTLLLSFMYGLLSSRQHNFSTVVDCLLK
jgi:hypothetical protein